MFKKLIRKLHSQKVRAVTVSVFILLAATTVAAYPVLHKASADTTYYWDIQTYYWDSWACTGGYISGTQFANCDASTVGQGWSSTQCFDRIRCDLSDSCGNVSRTYVTCAARTTCTPDSSCAATTNVGSTCTDSCGNSYAGTKAVCVANSACAASTAVGSTCTDSCGNNYAGTLVTYSQASYGPGYSEGTYYSQGSYAPVGCGTPAATITAAPSRVRTGQTSVLTLAGTGVTTSCTITGPGVNSTTAASSCTVAKTLTTPAITAQTTYTVSCDSSTNLTKVIVNPIPTVVEF